MFRLEQLAKRTKNEPGGRASALAPRETLPPANQQEKTIKAITRTPPNLFRVETNALLSFVRLTHMSNCTHVSGRTTTKANKTRRIVAKFRAPQLMPRSPVTEQFLA